MAKDQQGPALEQVDGQQQMPDNTAMKVAGDPEPPESSVDAPMDVDQPGAVQSQPGVKPDLDQTTEGAGDPQLSEGSTDARMDVDQPGALQSQAEVKPDLREMMGRRRFPGGSEADLRKAKGPDETAPEGADPPAGVKPDPGQTTGADRTALEGADPLPEKPKKVKRRKPGAEQPRNSMDTNPTKNIIKQTAIESGDQGIRGKYEQFADLGMDENVIRKLEHKVGELAPTDSMKCLLSCIHVGTKMTRGALESNMIVVLGNTRVGKSTTINYLSGCEMVEKDPTELGVRGFNKVIAVKGRSEGGPKDEVTGIGHSMGSMTFIPSLVTVQRSNGEPVTICDCPGFGDNRGFEINIANAVNTCTTLHAAESVRILLLLDLATLTNGGFVNVAIEALAGLFGTVCRAEQHAESIYIGVTKVPPNTSWKVSDLQRFLLQEQTIHSLLKKCAERNLVIIDPLVRHPESKSAAELLELLFSRRSITDHRAAIQTSLNAGDREAIGDITSPFLNEITEKILEDDYSAVAKLLQTLSKLDVLKHPKVEEVLRQAEERVHQALLNKKKQISDTLLGSYEESQQKAAELKRLLNEKLTGAKILDDYFGPRGETPATDAVNECTEQIKAHETDAVRSADALLEGGIDQALAAFEADVHKDCSTSGDVFKELDRQLSGVRLQLVREQNSQIPAPPCSSLPSLAKLREMVEKLAAEMRRRPSSYCLVTDVQQLQDMRTRMQQKFLEHLDTGVLLTMEKWYVLALSLLQHGFAAVVQKHCAEILESRGQFDFPRDFPKVKAWFGMNIADPLAKATAWAATACSGEQKDQLLNRFKRMLLDKMEELCQRAQDHKNATEADEAVRFINDHSIMPRDLASFSAELNEKLQILGGTGQQCVLTEQLERLQQKLDTFCNTCELKRMFADSSFQQLCQMLLNAKTIQEDIPMLQVPCDELTSTFKSLLLEERATAEKQMTTREILDNESIKKMSDILRIFSVDRLEEEFFDEHKVTQGPLQGIPWGTIDTKTIEDSCQAMLAYANEGNFEKAVHLLLKYRDVTNLLAAGHKNGGVFRDAFKAGVDGLARAHDPAYVAHGVGELLHIRVRQESTSSHIKMLAQEIIETFVFFSTALVERFNEIAGAVSFDEAVPQVKDLEGQPVLQTRGEETLKECFARVKETYNRLMSEVLKPGARTKEVQQRVVGDIKKNCDTLAREIGMTKDFSLEPTRKKVSMLIGNIFAMWSLVKSGEAYTEGNKNKMVQPHDPQVLVILHMLGIGLGGPVKNHIAQVGTGEGKSVCLGTLGALFRLLGFEVNIVCYSPLLSERDQKQFQPLFDKLGVAPTYSCIGTLCEQVQESDDLDLRKHTENVLTKTRVDSPSSTTPPRKEHRILIIDEVDVFFGEDFYGKFYTPSHTVEDKECIRLVRYVWEHRMENLTSEAVARTQEAQDLRQKFSGMTTPLLQNIIEQLLRDTTFFQNSSPSHEFTVGRDEDGQQRVGYLDEVTGVVNYQLREGYRTAFAFAHSMDVSKVIVNPTEAEIASMMAVNLNCGMLPYAELPNFFDLKLGLTGSLESASEREMSILKSIYNFSVFSVMPSIFAKKPLVVEPPEVFAGDLEAEYYEKIKENIQGMVNAGRAVLVVFQNFERLHSFRQWLKQNPYANEPDLHFLTGDETLEKKEELISMAARSRRVTLIIRAFGRGSDFVCRDSAVKNAGGLHVIQTFACDLKSEEVQIKGRTCRQDNPGSYNQILFLADLKPFGIDMEAGITDFHAQRASNPGLTWSAFIDQKRESVLLQKRFQKIENSRVASEERFVQTQAFIQAATGGEWEKATDLLVKFNSSSARPEGKHTLPKAAIFVVDRTEQSILDACIDSVKHIVDSHLGDTDIIGLYGLGEGWIITPSSKGDIAGTLSAMLASAKKVSGRCMLYRSILHAVRMLSTLADYHKWLVVLTDTVDLEDLFGKHEWESGKKVLALHSSEERFLEGSIVDAREGGALLDIDFGADGGQQVRKEDAQPFAETEDAMQGVAMDPAVAQKLRLAGARKGALRVALDWKSTDDLDLHVETPAGEICYERRECGGGELDVDMNVEHDRTDAVENIYFDVLAPGTYKVRVVLFNSGGKSSKDPVDCKVWFTTQFRVHVSEPDKPPRTVSGTTMKFEAALSEDSEEHADRHVFSFTFDGPTDGLSDATFGDLCGELRQMSDMSMAIVDCSKQSEWNKRSAKWSLFKENIQQCLRSAEEGKNNDTFHLEAGNEQQIQECFKEIASLMVIAGTAKPRAKTQETNVTTQETDTAGGAGCGGAGGGGATKGTKRELGESNVGRRRIKKAKTGEKMEVP